MNEFHIAMDCKKLSNRLTEEHQVTIIRLKIFSHSFIYQSHAMRRIEKISVKSLC